MKLTRWLTLSMALFGAAGCESSDEAAETAPVTEAQCVPKIPEAPDPLPADFDWTPLAEAYCSELGACGYRTDGCVDTYLKAIAEPPPDPPDSPDPAPVAAGPIVLGCQDSDDYKLNPDACAP